MLLYPVECKASTLGDILGKKAIKYQVHGWVKNLPDNRVEAVFEGEEADVKKIINCVNKGPTFAKVTDLKLEWLDYIGKYKDFQIKY